MALKADLMASSLPVAAASKLGFDAPGLAVAAAGASQSTATVLVSNFSIVSSGAGGVLVNERFSMSAVINTSGGSLNVYPPVGGSINGLSANTAFAVGNNKQVLLFPAGLNWIAILSA